MTAFYCLFMSLLILSTSLGFLRRAGSSSAPCLPVRADVCLLSSQNNLSHVIRQLYARALYCCVCNIRLYRSNDHCIRREPLTTRRTQREFTTLQPIKLSCPVHLRGINSTPSPPCPCVCWCGWKIRLWTHYPVSFPATHRLYPPRQFVPL